MKKLMVIVTLIVLILVSFSIYAKKGRRSAKRYGRATSSVGGMKKPIEVRGQTRTLSMGLTLKNKKEQIDFIKPRTEYDDEIKDTAY